jgi:hypothetical protein
MVSRHAPLAKSNATKRRPRGLVELGEPARTEDAHEVSVPAIIFANAGQGSGRPNGRSLETTMLPLGAIARSSGLSRAGSASGHFPFCLVAPLRAKRHRARGKPFRRLGDTGLLSR